MTDSANTVCRLAHCTSSLRCALTMLNTFITRFNSGNKRIDCRQFMQLITDCHHHRQRSLLQKTLIQSRIEIQSP